MAMFLNFLLLLVGYRQTILANADGQPDAAQLCQKLAQDFPNNVDFPNTTAYTQDSVYWSSEANLNPPCIFTPAKTADVSSAVLQLVAESVPFAVRSGGHAWIPGWSSTHDGVVFNLKNLDSVTLINGNKSARIGSGTVWSNVYSTLQDKGYTVTGGRADSVGVGGLLMGGGLSFYLYSHGFACDNIEEFEIVLANGTITTASASKNAGLFRGLKGSGTLFGIVTHFTLKTIPVTPVVYGGYVGSNEASFPRMFTALADYNTAGFDPKAHVIVTFIKFGNLTLSENIYFYQDPNVTGTPAVFKKLQNIDPPNLLLNDIGKRTIANLTQEIGAVGSGTRQKYHPFTIINPTADVISKLWDIARAEFTDELMNSIPGLLFTLDYVPYPETTIAAGVANGKNMLGLDRQAGSNNTYMNVHYYIQWTNASDDEKVVQASQAAHDKSIALVKQKRMYNPFIYMNYASKDQDVLGSYGKDNVDILRGLQRKYDPTLEFERLVKGGFKIPKVPASGQFGAG